MISLREVWRTKSLRLIFILFILVALIASIQDLLHPLKMYVGADRPHHEYNNYEIFRSSFYHLLAGRDLYAWYPAEHWDLYKYSPAFSLFFGLFAIFPDYIGLPLWSLLNSLIVFFALASMPGYGNRQKNAMLLYCVIELLTSIQNTQSNGLMAGLIILCFVSLERSNYFFACFCVVFSIYIKLFGAVAFALFLLYPGKIKLAGYTLFWMLVLAIIPALVTPVHTLMDQYRSWLHLLQEDHEASQGLGLVGLLNTWFNTSVSKNGITIFGIGVFCIPLLRIREYKQYAFRILLLSSILLWTIVFNHKAESPTFIISMCGIAIWYFFRPRSWADRILLILAFLLTSLSVSDLCPPAVREHFIKPYNIKGLMSVIIWFRVIIEMLWTKDQEMISTLPRPRSSSS